MGVLVGVAVGVLVGVTVGVMVGVLVSVAVGVIVGVGVAVGQVVLVVQSAPTAKLEAWQKFGSPVQKPRQLGSSVNTLSTQVVPPPFATAVVP